MHNKLHATQHRGHNQLAWLKAVLWVGWIAIGLNIWLITQ